MADNLIQLPRFIKKSAVDPLGFYIRVGRNDHKRLLAAIAPHRHRSETYTKIEEQSKWESQWLPVMH